MRPWTEATRPDCRGARPWQQGSKVRTLRAQTPPYRPGRRWHATSYPRYPGLLGQVILRPAQHGAGSAQLLAPDLMAACISRYITLPCKLPHSESRSKGQVPIYSRSRQQMTKRLAGDEALSSHPPGHAAVVPGHQVLVAGERPQRKIGAVAVIAQVEHARETDRVVQLLVPFAALARRAAAGRRCRARPPRSRPRPRPSARAAPRPSARACWRRLVPALRPVAAAALAPAAIRLLARLQPLDGLAHVGLRHVLAGGVQRAQHRPGAVDVVGAPAAEPGAVGFLLAPQIVERLRRPPGWSRA